MPNHLHGIVLLGARVPNDVGESRHASAAEGDHTGSPLPADDCGKPSLADVVGWFKTMTTNDYIRGVKTDGWPPFSGRLWQRSYHEHIIRNDRAFDRIRAYIANNPSRWADDEENADRPAR